MPGPKPRSPDGEVGGGHTKGLHRGTEGNPVPQLKEREGEKPL